MLFLSKIIVWAMIPVILLGSVAKALPQETPPQEPPYVTDSEFDSPTEATPTKTEASKKKSDKGTKYIHHPDAQKGLIRIEQDGTYVYKVKTKKTSQTGIFRVGMMEPPRITAADGIHDFSSMYGSDPMTYLSFEYEWQPFSKYGKLGLQGGIGLAMAEGNGFFVNDPVTVPQESYTFIAVPLTLGVVYRLEYFKRQWVAPYISGGAAYIGVAELRDDNRNNFSGTPAAYGSGGVMFNISAMDKKVAFELSSEYGIGNLWLIADYRYQQAFSEDLDFSGGIISLGIGADF